MMKVLTIAIIYDTKAVEHLKGKERSCCFSIAINELTTDVLKDAAKIYSVMGIYVNSSFLDGSRQRYYC